MSRRLWSVALVLGLTLTACGSPSPTAQSVKSSFVPQTVDALDDVGRGVSIALDKDGNTRMAYIGLEQVLAPGEIPPARPATAPALPAVLTASQKGGVFTHGYVVQTDITSSKPKKVPVNESSSTGIAVTSTGALDVVWNEFPGVFFATAPSDTAPFGDPQTVSEGYGSSPAVALDSKDTPWVAFVQQDAATGALTLQAATLQGKKWTTEQAADLGKCSGACPPIKVGIAVQDDQPIVAYTDAAGGVFVATRSGSSWSPQTVQSNADASGASMGVGKDGSIAVAFATAQGQVRLATADGAQGPWNVSTVGSYTPPKASPSPLASPTPEATGATPTPSASASPAPPALQPGTAAGVDPDKGTIFVAWTDPTARQVKLASGSGGGSMKEVATPGTQEGEFPALTVSGDGTVDLAWYNADAQDLNLGLYPEKTEAIAQPAPSTPASQPQGSGGGGPGCPKDSVEIIAPVGAGGAGFQTKDVTAPSGNFTLCFNNEDTGVTHNVEIFESATGPEGSSIAQDSPFAGAKIDTITVSGAPPGKHFFHCIVHPTTMTGTLTVK